MTTITINFRKIIIFILFLLIMALTFSCSKSKLKNDFDYIYILEATSLDKQNHIGTCFCSDGVFIQTPTWFCIKN
jgi:TM2 domain-containing membrane protein YozV